MPDRVEAQPSCPSGGVIPEGERDQKEPEKAKPDEDKESKPADPAEPGEWFEPGYLEQQRLGAVRLVVGDGDVKTLDFRISSR